MKAKTRKLIRGHFERSGDAVFWPSDLARTLNEHRQEWDALDVRAREVTEFLQERSVLRLAEFTSSKYRPIIRYIHGNPSPYKLALSLQHNSFLSHGTALTIHNLALPQPIIYANKEQTQKPDPEGLSQTAIQTAFKNPQRRSNYVFHFKHKQYVLLAGKNTGRAGVVKMKTPEGEEVDSTDLERTLIDIVVRPNYCGGVENVESVYRSIFHKADIDHMIKLLYKLNYLYPYAQSIGFLLEWAGRPSKDLVALEKLRSEYDFFLDYGLKEPSYDEKWKLYYPSKMSKTRSTPGPR